MKREHKISVITVDYNGLDLTCALIDSLQKNVSMTVEIVVVDNASSMDEAAIIRERYPFVTAVRSEVNLGFAGGNNLGVRNATGDMYFFLNNDTEVIDDNMQALLAPFEQDPSVGAVCPKIRFWSGDRPIQFAGYTPMRGISMKNDLTGFMQPDEGQFDSPAETPFVHGAAMMVSRDAYQDVGPMPECYFLYFEELDWSLMFSRKGWKMMYEPSFTVYHKESATTGQDSPLRSYYMQRNRQLFAYRNYKGMKRAAAILYARYLSGGKRIMSALAHSRMDLVKAVARGNRDFRKMKRVGLC